MDETNGKYKEALFDAFGSSTSHGLPKIVNAKYGFIRICWFIVFVISTSYGIFIVSKSLSAYSKHDVVSRIDIARDSPTTFPAVTICNLNAFNFDYERNNDWITKELIASGMDYAVNFSMSKVSQVHNPNLFYNMDNLFNEVKLLAISRSEEKWRRFLGYDLGSEMLLSCQYNKMDCDSNDFYRFWTNDYGNCYTFNSGRDSHGVNKKLLQTNKVGPDQGLQLELLVGNPTKTPRFSHRSGIVVMVHNNSKSPVTLPFPIAIETGRETYLSVDRKFISKLGHPYSNCLSDMKSFSSYSEKIFGYITKLNLSQRYDRDICYKICFQDQVASHCGCFDTSTPRLDEKSYCFEELERECLKNVTNVFLETSSDILCENACPVECAREEYTVSTYTSTYPTKYYLDQLISVAKISPFQHSPYRFLNDTLIENKYSTDSEIYELIKTNVVKMTVNYHDLSYTTIQEAPAMTIETFFGILGGQFAIFIGISFVSLFEVVELLIEFLYLCAENDSSFKVKSGQIPNINTVPFYY